MKTSGKPCGVWTGGWLLPGLAAVWAIDIKGFGGHGRGLFFESDGVYRRLQSQSRRVGAIIINKTSFRIGEYEQFKTASLDPYVAMREVYIQYRTKQIQDKPREQQETTPPVGQQSLSSN